jgi:hypothetical protein
MNNEPVAFVTGLNKFDPVMADTVLKVGTPLYTHPAKTLTDDPLVNFKPVWIEKPELTLTDEEILTIQDMCHLKNVGYNTFIMRFAKAILRKAQEK